VMESVLAALKDTPIPTILVIAGIVFLLLAIAGQLAGRIVVAPERQRWAGVIGSVLLAAGIVLYVVPQGRPASPKTEGVPTSRPSPPPATQQPSRPSAGSSSTQPPPPTPGSGVQASTEEQEPNNDISSATLIAEGTTVRGRLATIGDRDFFKFTASSTRTRIILRKQFSAALDVMDRVERRIVWRIGYDDTTISFWFESDPGEIYYVLVKSHFDTHGDYQLLVRKE
jgi:hypothetical protein